MAIEKGKLFEIIQKVGESEDLNEDNLLERVKNELKEKDAGEHSKFSLGLDKNHPFSIKVSEKAAEDWTLLHLAVACNNLLIVELLLKKKASVNTRIKDGSKDDGLTALHIAASHGHQDMVKRLVSDDRVNPSLKSKNKTPREMVGENKEDMVKMLEAAEESYRTKPQKKAKDLNIKLRDGSTYYLSQGNHMTPASSIVNENNVLKNGTDPYLKQHSAACSDESYLGLEQEEIEELEVQLGELRVQLEGEQEENKSLKQKIQNLENRNATLNSELEKNKNQRSKTEALLKKAQAELKSYVTEGVKSPTIIGSKAVVSAANEGWTPLHSTVKISDVNVTRGILKTSKIDLNATDPNRKTILHQAAYNSHLDKVKYLVEEGANFEIKDKNGKSPLDLATDKQNNEVVGFLQEKVKSKTDLNKSELEKTEKKPLFPRITYVSLVATSIVSSILSIASGLFILSIIATSVTSALVAGGITYTISKPTTELKEVAIQDQQYGVCKT